VDEAYVLSDGEVDGVVRAHGFMFGLLGIVVSLIGVTGKKNGMHRSVQGVFKPT